MNYGGGTIVRIDIFGLIDVNGDGTDDGNVTAEIQRLIQVALSHRGSQAWAADATKGKYGPGISKCNVFVNDIVKEADLGNIEIRNGRYFLSYNPVKPGEIISGTGMPFTGPVSQIDTIELNGIGLATIHRWQIVDGPALPGDIITDGTHMAIQTGVGKSIHVSGSNCYKITENSWGNGTKLKMYVLRYARLGQ